MSDKHLERKEVLNLVYTQQADRMADDYARLMSDFSQMTAWGRGLESDLSWARAELLMVKSEVERLSALVESNLNKSKLAMAKSDASVRTLEAQVERLTLENSQYEEHHKYGQNVITSLREEVERLTKAGDAMAEELKACYRAEGYDPADSETIPKWNAAKEGKQP